MLISLLLVTVFSLECYGWNLADLIVPHFGPSTKAKCQRGGQLCKFDRHCCAGLECRMSIQDYNIGYYCRSRLVEHNYVEFTGGPSWKDYQESASELEYEDPAYFDTEGLFRKNAELKRKLAELKLLRKKVRQQQLKDVKRRLEDAEIEVLREEKRKYEAKQEQEINKLRQNEIEDELIEMEKKEVNHTLSKQNRLANVYLDMLGDFTDKKNI
ncbi:uncharacterized protein LOC128983619 [Macrosteles quadrilineatus]|uniref:uncharacterized protein LOC128983619 n=1 Tax=Macrosteles quadrilineatus TaxID=74068 RepID=UPI0023E2C1B1|nr:uncharacterized protein LOC128983619 [Macrosteles quadrilineatus]